MNLSWFADSDEGFYNLMGPFFASRSVAHEIGACMCSDASMSWLLALDGNRVIGFGAAVIVGRRGSLRMGYVIHSMRKNGIGAHMLNERIRYVAERCKIIRVNTRRPRIFVSYGFHTTSQTRNGWYRMIVKCTELVWK